MTAPLLVPEDYAATLDEVAAADGKGCNRDRMRQIQENGLRTLRMRVKKYGLAPGDADLMARSKGEPDIYTPRAVCVDCGKATGDASEARCPSCRRYEVARGDGYAEGTYSARAFISGALNILHRWPGTTT